MIRYNLLKIIRNSNYNNNNNNNNSNYNNNNNNNNKIINNNNNNRVKASYKINIICLIIYLIK
jgi:hypothetical protein